jgi:hypothetical protein
MATLRSQTRQRQLPNQTRTPNRIRIGTESLERSTIRSLDSFRGGHHPPVSSVGVTRKPNGNIYTATVFSAGLVGATGQESLQEIQIGGLPRRASVALIVGRDRMGNLALAAVDFLKKFQT